MKILTSVSEEEWSSITNIGAAIYLKKDEMISRKGDKSNKEFFLEDGIVRGFMVDEAGNEKSTSFFEEGEFISTQNSKRCFYL